MDGFDVQDVATPEASPAPGSSPAGPLSEWSQEWVVALQRMELDVSSAEELLRSLHDHVEEPPEDLSVLGGEWSRRVPSEPLPTEFADRARSLLARQSRVSEELARAMIESRQQVRGLKKFDRAESFSRFVDTAL